MPTIRIQKQGEQEGESLSRTGGVGTGELNRLTSNLTLAEHLGRFIAGEVATQYQNENLADLLKGKNMIMISGSWG